MKKLIFLVLLAMTTISLTAVADSNPTTSESSSINQTASMQGRVVDKDSKEPLAGVLVSIEGTNIQVYTDFEGNFSFKNIAPGVVNLKFSLVSYQDNLLRNINLSPNQSSVLEIAIDN